MARKLMTIEETAAKLGVSVDKINEMRERGEIHAYRDGGSWKFREDEVERVAADLGADGGEFSLDDDEGVLGGSSIVAGGSSPSGSAISLSSVSAISDLDLATDESVIGKGDAAASGPKSDISAVFDDLDTFDIDLASGVQKAPSAKGKGKATPPPASTIDSGLGLADDDLDLDIGGSALDLTSENEDLVLGERPDSDVTRDSSTSGISLGNPDQSGLSLEDEPVDVQLGGSSVDSFELGEDDAEKMTLGSSPSVKTDEDFLLEPLAAAEDDEPDSGSQVIALEDDEDFATPASSGAIAVDDTSPVGAFRGDPDAMMVPALPETPYSAWNVVGLVCCVLLLLFAGMFTYDLARNMWSWNEPYVASSSMMESLAKMMGWMK